MNLIMGIDEAGRGCWAGPLVASAVILPPNLNKDKLPWKLGDSKKLTKKQRETAYQNILIEALDYGIGIVEADEVDKVGLTESVRLAMSRAVDNIKTEYDQIIIDGNYNYLPSNSRTTFLIKADDIVPSVSAASILAKVTRDRIMTNISVLYPEYGFDKHVGYGTKAHMDALQEHGVTVVHRKSYKPIQGYMKQALEEHPNNPARVNPIHADSTQMNRENESASKD